MHRLLKVMMAALAAIFVLSLASGLASARNRLEISTTAILASGDLTFGASGINITCEVTLHITANRLINKVHGELIGHVTSVLTANVRPREAGCTPLPPFLVVFLSIEGTLPRIDGITVLIRAGFLIRARSIFGTSECLYRDEIAARASENPIRRSTTEDGEVSLERRLTGICPSQAELRGTFTWTPAVTVILLER